MPLAASHSGALRARRCARRCLGAAALFALASGPGCTCGRASLPAEASQDFGDIASPAPPAADMFAYLALPRSIVEKLPPAPPAPAGAHGRRAVVALCP